MTVALVGGAQLPIETAQEFTKATGFTVAVVPVDGVDALSKAGADVVLGLDGADALQATAAGTIAASAPQDTATLAGTVVDGAAAAIAYGRDDVCVIADKSWMSANGRPLPTSFGDLTSPRIRALLTVPDPASSSVGRAFVQEAAAQTGEGLGSFAQSLNPRVDSSLGGTIAAWTAGAHVSEGYLSEVVGASAGSSGAYSLIVAPRSLAAAAATNTGADSYGTAISSTCIARIMYAAPTSSPASDGAESLIAWLQGETAQRSLATTGAVYPIDGVLAADTKAGWLMGITGDPIVADETVGSLDAMSAWLATWSSALASPSPTTPSTPDPRRIRARRMLNRSRHPRITPRPTRDTRIRATARSNPRRTRPFSSQPRSIAGLTLHSSPMRMGAMRPASRSSRRRGTVRSTTFHGSIVLR